MGICPPTNLQNRRWYVWISLDISEPLSNEGCSNTSDSSPLFYKSKHFLRTNLESVISLTARRTWHVCFHPHVFYKVLIHMLRLKALYKVFEEHRKHFWDPWWGTGEASGPLVVTTILTPGWKRHPLLVKSGIVVGLGPSLIDIVAMLHDCSRAVAAVFVEQKLPVKQV